MKKALKILVVLFIVVCIAIAALTVVAKSYLTEERVRTYVIGTAEKSLGRKVKLGAIQVSIFRGISIKDFEIEEKDSPEAFIKAEDFVLRYQLLPLLSRSLVIDELTLINASLRVQKNADGTFNFSDISRQPAGESPKEQTTGGPGLPVSLNIRTLSLRNAVIDFTEPEGRLAKARIAVDATLGIISPSSQMISSEGSFRFTLIEALFKGRPQPLKDLVSEGTYKLSLMPAAKKADIHEVKAAIGKIPVMLKGYVSYAGPLSFSLDLNMPETRLSAVQQAAGPFLPADMLLDGSAALAVSAEQSQATSSRMTFKGQMTMHNAAVAAKGYRPVFNGTIRFTPDRISLDSVRLVAAESSADITGQIRNYSGEPDIQLNLSAKALNLDAIASPVQKPAAEKPAAPSGEKEEKEFEPINRKMRAAGTIAVDKILYKGVAVQNFRTTYEFSNNVFRIPSMTGSTLSGSFNLQSAVDLSKRGTAYALNADINGIRLEDITAAFAPKAKDTLYGSLYGKMNFTGAGTLRQSMKQNLRGKGNFSVKNGKIKNARISDDLLGFLGLKDLREIAMDKADGMFTAADGIVNLTSLITSRDLILDEKGTIGMDERLDLGVLVKASEKLSPKMLSQSSVAQFLSEEKGWTTIPLRVSGTIAKPSYSVDMKYAGRKATEKLQQKAGEELFKALSGDKQKKEKAPPQEKKKGGSTEDLLKDLFK